MGGQAEDPALDSHFQILKRGLPALQLVYFPVQLGDMGFYGCILCVSLFLRSQRPQYFSEFLRVREAWLASDLVDSVRANLQLSPQLLDLCISLPDDSIQALDFYLQTERFLLGRSQAFFIVADLPFFVDESIFLLADQFRIIERAFPAGGIGLAQREHSPHRAIEFVLEEEQSFAEIFLVVALQDHLRFSVELSEQVEQQLLGVFESAEVGLPAEDQLLLALPLQTGPDVGGGLVAVS